MKKLFPYLLIFLSVSCSENIFDEEPLHPSSETISSNTAEEWQKIKQYITYTQKHASNTRSTNSGYTVEPYIYKGDTIMYIVNHENGWEIFSNDQRVPMLLFSSETGNFHLKDTATAPPAFVEYFNTTVEEIYLAKQTITEKIIPYGLWDEIEKIPIGPVIPIDSTPTKEMEIDTMLIDHLIKIRWNSEDGFCRYTPFLNNRQCLPGCYAVALGQFLYYNHYKYGIPATTCDNAVYDSINNKYIFSGASSTIWDNMAEEIGDLDKNRINNTALFLGYVAQSIHANFGTDQTSATPSNCIAFLKTQGFSFKYDSIDYQYVISQIENGNVVIARSRMKETETGKESGHAYLIDKYRKITWPMINMDGTRFIQHHIGMIWGYLDETLNNVWCEASSLADWNIPIAQFNSNRKIFRTNEDN